MQEYVDRLIKEKAAELLQEVIKAAEEQNEGGSNEKK